MSLEWSLLSIYFTVWICVYQVVVDIYMLFVFFFIPTFNFQKCIDLPISVLSARVLLRNLVTGKKLLFYQK